MDPFAIERIDIREDYGEDRFVLIGLVENQVFAVVYTERVHPGKEPTIRVISARKATHHEQEEYFRENRS